MKKLSIVIPAYNEEKTLNEILKKVIDVKIPGIEKEIIVIDNNSTDRTLDIAKSIPQIITLTEIEIGKGAAVKKGLERASGDMIIIQDADLEYNPADIPILLEKMLDAKTVVYGSRNLKPHRKGAVVARLGVWFLTEEFNLLFGTKLTDLWTCYKLFPREASVYFEKGGFESELSFSANLIKNGFKIEEVSISYNNPRSIAEGKKIRYVDGILGIFTIFLYKLKK